VWDKLIILLNLAQVMLYLTIVCYYRGGFTCILILKQQISM